MENSQTEANTLKQQLEDKIKILFDKESNLTQSEKTIDEKVGELNNLRTAYQGLEVSSKQEKASLTQKIQTLEEQNDNLSKEVESMQQQIEQYNMKIENGKTVQNELEQQVEGLNQDMK